MGFRLAIRLDEREARRVASVAEVVTRTLGDADLLACARDGGGDCSPALRRISLPGALRLCGGRERRRLQFLLPLGSPHTLTASHAGHAGLLPLFTACVGISTEQACTALSLHVGAWSAAHCAILVTRPPLWITDTTQSHAFTLCIRTSPLAPWAASQGAVPKVLHRLTRLELTAQSHPRAISCTRSAPVDCEQTG